MDDYSKNNIIKQLINKTPNIIIHEHVLYQLACKNKKSQNQLFV